MCKGTAGAASHAAALCPPIKEKNMFQAFLIKYGEIGVKGKNRYVFEDALVDRIKQVLENVEGSFVVTKE